MTSAPTFTVENGSAELVSSDGQYKYVVRNITGPVTMTLIDAPDGGGEGEDPTTPSYLPSGQTIKKLENIGEVVTIGEISNFKYEIPENKGDYHYITGVIPADRVADAEKNYETEIVGKPVLDVYGTCSTMTKEEFDTYYTSNYYTIQSYSNTSFAGSIGSSNGETREVNDGDIALRVKY